jgi:hypothetical protein
VNSFQLFRSIDFLVVVAACFSLMSTYGRKQHEPPSISRASIKAVTVGYTLGIPALRLVRTKPSRDENLVCCCDALAFGDSA